MSRRRVVVTGLGLICAVGNTSAETWSNLLAGKSGVAQITGFDATGFACTIASTVARALASSNDSFVKHTRKRRRAERLASFGIFIAQPIPSRSPPTNGADRLASALCR